jgi:hypothetical protein
MTPKNVDITAQLCLKESLEEVDFQTPVRLHTTA